MQAADLLGVQHIPFPAWPDSNSWRHKVHAPLAPMAVGLAFELAA